MEKQKNSRCMGTITLNIKDLQDQILDIEGMANELGENIQNGVNNNTFILLYFTCDQIKKSLNEMLDMTSDYNEMLDKI